MASEQKHSTVNHYLHLSIYSLTSSAMFVLTLQTSDSNTHKQQLLKFQC